MFDRAGTDAEEVATALADQTDYEHRWLLNPPTRQVVFWVWSSPSDRGGEVCRRVWCDSGA